MVWAIMPRTALGSWPSLGTWRLPSTTTATVSRSRQIRSRRVRSALIDDPLLTRVIGRAGLDVLLASEYADSTKVAAIGYCFGGTMSLELARDGVDLEAVVGFHSGLSTSRPEDASNISGSVLVCIGADDPLIPPAQRVAFEAEMRAGGVDWRMNVYGGAVHSFTNPAADGSNPVLAYEPRADARSWRAMLDLFAEKFHDD